jgi:hypothetical protein
MSTVLSSGDFVNVPGNWSIPSAMTFSPFRPSRIIRLHFKATAFFPGLVYLESPKDISDAIDLKLDNVVAAPMFRYKTASSWESAERLKPGLLVNTFGYDFFSIQTISDY